MLANRVYGLLGGIILLMISPFFVYGQGGLDPVKFKAELDKNPVKVGEIVNVRINATIDGKWHLYSINNEPSQGPVPTSFSIQKGAAAIVDSIAESEVEIAYDPNFDTELGWHTKDASFRVPVQIQNYIDDAGIELAVRYMVCDDKSCLPPKTKSIVLNVTTDGIAEGFEPVKESGGNTTGNTVSTSESSIFGSGLLSFLWIALTAGFAALVTPCVFPMIPLTVSYFTKNTGERNVSKSVGQALLFGLAIIVAFTVLGALLSLVIGASGANQFAANPWVNLFIGVILIIFAISLLGMFELRLPHQLTNYFNRKSNESSGLVGIIFMALTISAVSFSCTAPFVGGVLAATAGGEWFFPIVGMAAFSAAFSTPFILFAMFPSWLENLPQSGSWMNIVKVILGFIELAAATKFLSNADLVWNWGILSRPFVIASWIAIFLLAGFYILGFIQLKYEEKPKNISTGRLMLSLPFLLFSFYLIPGLLGASLGIWDAWLPPKQATDVSVVASVIQRSGASGNGRLVTGGEQWVDNYQQAVEVAKKEKKPVFIDFTGYTCTNCRAMESNVFPLKEVQQRFDKMVKLRLYTDDGTKGPEHQKFQFELTGTVALPTYAIVNPENNKLIDQLVGYTSKDKFTAFLTKGLKLYHN